MKGAGLGLHPLRGPGLRWSFSGRRRSALPLALDATAGDYGDYNLVWHAEYPMVRWLEANGYDVSYFTDVQQ